MTEAAPITPSWARLPIPRRSETSHAGSHFSTPEAEKRAALVAERPEGRKVYYRAQPEGLEPLVDWMSHYGVFWRERFANLKTLLKEIDLCTMPH